MSASPDFAPSPSTDSPDSPNEAEPPRTRRKYRRADEVDAIPPEPSPSGFIPRGTHTAEVIFLRSTWTTVRTISSAQRLCAAELVRQSVRLYLRLSQSGAMASIQDAARKAGQAADRWIADACEERLKRIQDAGP